MVDTNLAYMAGIIDGEGTIVLSAKSHKGRTKPDIIGYVGITNTNKQLIDWLQDKFGGNIVTSPQKNLKWKDKYHLRFYSNDAKHLLEQVLPYLVIKREQAELFLKFRDMVKSSDGSWRSKEEIQSRLELVKRCQMLNAKGKLIDAERLNERAS